MAQLSTATTNFNQTVVALVQKQLETLLRGPLPHLMPGNFRQANFVKGTNNTMRFLNIPDLAVTAGTISAGTPPWLTEGTPPTPGTVAIGFEEFSAGQAGILQKVTDVALLQSPLDLLREVSERVARNAIATADLYVAQQLGAGTNVMYAGSASSSATLVSGNILTGALVKLAVARLASANVPRFADGTYHAIVQPGVVYDLMLDTTVGGWIDAARYGAPNKLLTGEIGEYAGVKFIASTNAFQKLATQGPALTNAGNAAIAATDVVTTTGNHGLVAGNRIKITALTGGAGLTSGNTYYLVAPVTATTFKLSATPNGAAIDITTDSSAFTANQVNDINSTFIFGPEAYVFGDWTTIQTKFTPPGGRGDELEQSALIGWKGFFGAMLIGQGANATGVSGPRYIRIETASGL